MVMGIQEEKGMVRRVERNLIVVSLDSINFANMSESEKTINWLSLV